MSQPGRVTTRASRRWLITSFWCCWFFCFAQPAWSSEAALRVAIVFKFLKFIEWPDTPTAEIQLCALSTERDTLRELQKLNNLVVDKRRVAIQLFAENNELLSHLDGCKVIYWPSPDDQLLLPDPFPRNIVLIVDQDQIQIPQASIALQRMPKGRIGFFVNQASIARSGVKISSQLLKLAINLRNQPEKTSSPDTKEKSQGVQDD